MDRGAPGSLLFGPFICNGYLPTLQYLLFRIHNQAVLIPEAVKSEARSDFSIIELITAYL